MPQITRTWSIPTSPRNPYKIANELRLLSQFEGQVWNRETQLEYARLLPSIDSFEGEVSATYSDFSARDRINRAPKTFGFVRFDNNRIIQITDAGKRLIEGVRIEELFLRQLLKWQYPSVNHDDANYRSNFSIKPFLEVLRIVRNLDGIMKYELALFCVPLIKYSETENLIEEIREFRSRLSALGSNLDKKCFIKDTFIQRFSEIYQDDIISGNTFLREGQAGTVDNFIKTKIRNAKDYADAAIRYFRATGLFTISTHNYRLILKAEKIHIVDFILSNFNRVPEEYISNRSTFLDYLGNFSTPIIPQDDKNMLISEIKSTLNFYTTRSIDIDPRFLEKINVIDRLNIEELKDLKDALNLHLEEKVLEKEQSELRNFSYLSDIVGVFEKIQDRYNDEIPDKPLFFEWNIWRALSLLDDGNIKGNLRIDSNGSPVNAAVGNMPDIECYYSDFVLVVEVTLSKGQRQYETEGEPVPRHIGQVVAKLRQNNDLRPVYGLFIANNLNSSVIAHFYVLRRTEVQYYGGRAKIIPLNAEHFIQMLQHASARGRVHASDIHRFIQWADREADASPNEQDWYSRISSKVSNWTEVVL